MGFELRQVGEVRANAAIPVMDYPAHEFTGGAENLLEPVSRETISYFR